MAGDWIKLEHSTPDKPEVVQLAIILDFEDHDLAWAKCVRLWIWADQQSIDGNALSVTDSFIDRYTRVTGFAAALRKVGWLGGRDSRLSIPNFARHNGQSSKTRANTQKRVRKSRQTRNDPVTPRALPEKRREEKSNTLSLSKAGESFDSKDDPGVGSESTEGSCPPGSAPPESPQIQPGERDGPKSAHFTSPEFKAAWKAWVALQTVEHNRAMHAVTQEAQLYALAGFETPEATEIVRFSTSKLAKNLIVNGDHKPKQSRASPSKGRGQATTFEDGLLQPGEFSQ